MNDDLAISVEHLSKKYCRSLKRSMVYGLQDIVKAMLPYRAKTSRSIETDKLSQLRLYEFWALRDISFQVKRGERVGLVGVNGAGKSTLFSILSHIYAPTVGRAQMRGRLQALIALGAGFHTNLTGRENIYINAAILGMKTKEIEPKIDEIIDFAEIRDAIDAPVKTYSSGMTVRLGFAIAVQMKPDILLLDEVLSVGDGSFQVKSLKKATELTQSGCTIMLVSHNLLHIQSFSDRCLWLHEGKVKADGLTSEVLPEYDNYLARESGRMSKGNVNSLRRGTGFVSIESYELLNEKGNKLPPPAGGRLPEVSKGEDLRIRLSYRVKNASCGRLRFEVTIKDHTSKIGITTARSNFMDHLCQEGHRGTVEVVFSKLPLVEEEYCLFLAIDDDRFNATRCHVSLDEISPSFRVIATKEAFKIPRGTVRPILVEMPYQYTKMS